MSSILARSAEGTAVWCIAWFADFAYLFNSIKTLGIANGITYWKIWKACRKNPRLVLEWASLCEISACRCKLLGEREMEEALLSWAIQLRESHRIFSANASHQ